MLAVAVEIFAAHTGLRQTVSKSESESESEGEKYMALGEGGEGKEIRYNAIRCKQEM